MPVKKDSVKRSVVKKTPTTVKKAVSSAKTKTYPQTIQKPDLQDFLVEVQKKAYVIYEERLKADLPGDEIADWFAAEKEIKEKYNL